MKTILIVDKQLINREYLLNLLGSNGHRLVEAVDGQDGLQQARDTNPDLIIADILMPKMDGFAMVQELRADPHLASTPVIFYTATFLEEEAIKLARACGVEYVLTKPLETEQVLKAVNLLLEQTTLPTIPPLSTDFTVEHLQLLANKLYQKVDELEISNQELQKLSIELAKANARLQSLSFSDELTGLYNRRGFLELATKQLKLSKRSPHRFCLLYMDVDNLKRINDQFGHQAGDTALTQLSQILRQTFRNSDIIARIGGDEFVVLVIDPADDSAEIVQSRLQANVDAFNAQSQQAFHLSISTGILWIHSSKSYTIEEMISEADAAMYIQKQSKKAN